MYKNNKILVVIPARGGSKGIPRKNIRLLGGKPLIAHTIEITKASEYVDELVVTTDDNEIAFVAGKFGAKTIKRDGKLAEDSIPLDPVIYDATIKQEEKEGEKYDVVITVQPTSPLLKTKTLDLAIEKLLDIEEDNDGNEISYDTIISVVDDRHLSWGWDEENNKYYPLYKARLNRQYLPKSYKETGSIFASKRKFICENSRLGDNIGLIEVSKQESIDIDNYEDWWVAERILKKKKILIKTDASHDIGTGHVYRSLSIASKLINHEVIFLLDEAKRLDLRDGGVRAHERAILALDAGNVVEPVLDLVRKVHAKEARAARLGAEFGDVRDEYAPFAERGAVLHLMETVRAEMSDGAKLAALVFTAETVRRIFKDKDAMLFRQCHDRIHVHRIATDMHGHDHLRFRRDLARHIGGIHVERSGINISEDELRARAERIRHRGDERDRRHDHLIARTDIRIAVGNLKRTRAVRDKE